MANPFPKDHLPLTNPTGHSTHCTAGRRQPRKLASQTQPERDKLPLNLTILEQAAHTEQVWYIILPQKQ